MVTELLGNAALWPAEQVINQLAESDAHLKKSVAKFEGNVIQIQVTQKSLPTLPIRLSFESNKVRLTSIASQDFELDVNATVTASASTFSRILFSDGSKRSLVSEDLKIEGNTQLVQDLFVTMNQLDIQWEDLLSPMLGDIGTHQISEFIANAGAWLDESRSRMASNFDDYIKEEANLFPSGIELENFQDRLDQLKLRIDRTEARIHRLNAQIEQESQ